MGRKKSEEKNIKIFFTFYPSCRADCDDSLPVYERLSDGNTFDKSEFTKEKFFSTVITTVTHPCADVTEPTTIGTTAPTTDPTTDPTTRGTTDPTTVPTAAPVAVPATCASGKYRIAPAYDCPPGTEITTASECADAGRSGIRPISFFEHWAFPQSS